MGSDVGSGRPKELEAIVGFHLRLAQGAVYRNFTETFAELDLTQKQVSTLWVVADRPGLSQIEIGTMLCMDRATTMTMANRLEQRGFLRRTRSVHDKRKQTLFITAAGEEALRQAKVCIAQNEAWLKGRFSPEEVKNLVAMLARIHE